MMEMWDVKDAMLACVVIVPATEDDDPMIAWETFTGSPLTGGAVPGGGEHSHQLQQEQEHQH